VVIQSAVEINFISISITGKRTMADWITRSNIPRNFLVQRKTVKIMEIQRYKGIWQISDVTLENSITDF
jgi:hypothetical protein